MASRLASGYALDPDTLHDLIHQRIMRGDRARGSAEFLRDALRGYEQMHGTQDRIILTSHRVAVICGWAVNERSVSRRDIGRIKTYLALAERNPDLFPGWHVEREPSRRFRLRFTRRGAARVGAAMA